MKPYSIKLSEEEVSLVDMAARLTGRNRHSTMRIALLEGIAVLLQREGE